MMGPRRGAAKDRRSKKAHNKFRHPKAPRPKGDGGRVAPALPRAPPAAGAAGPKERAYQFKVDAARAVGYRETLLMQLNAVVLHWPGKWGRGASLMGRRRGGS